MVVRLGGTKLQRCVGLILSYCDRVTGGSSVVAASCCERRGDVKRDLDGGGANGVQPRDGDRTLTVKL